MITMKHVFEVKSQKGNGSVSNIKGSAKFGLSQGHG